MLLLLDLDNTVADREAAFRHWLAAVVPSADHAWVAEADRDGFRPRPEFLALVRERCGVDASLEEYRRLTLEGFPPVDPVVAARLTTLRGAGWRIGIVTNGEAGVQEATAERAGLTPLVDAVVVSGTEGVRKPDPRIFALAAERCGASLDGAWMIGDGVPDIAGAAAAGIRSVWLRRGRTWERDDVRPDLEADDLVAALDRLSNR